jgi:hypothetical protein
MGRVVHGANCLWGELSMGRVFRGAKCPWGELSMERTVRGAKCLWGEMLWGELSWGALSWGEFSWGELSRGELSWGELSWGEFRWCEWSGNPLPQLEYTSYHSWAAPSIADGSAHPLQLLPPPDFLSAISQAPQMSVSASSLVLLTCLWLTRD